MTLLMAPVTCWMSTASGAEAQVHGRALGGDTRTVSGIVDCASSCPNNICPAIEGQSFNNFIFACNGPPTEPELEVCCWAEDLPAGATMAPMCAPGQALCQMEWTPDHCQSGAHDVAFHCSLDLVTPNPCAGHFNVQNVNRAPVLSADPTSVISSPGGSIAIDLTALDPDTLECAGAADADTLTLTQTTGMAGLTDHGDGTGQWTGSFGSDGDYMLAFVVNDGQGDADQVMVPVAISCPVGQCCDSASGDVQPIDDEDACTDDSCDLGIANHVPIYDLMTECCEPATGDVHSIDDGDACTDDVCTPSGAVIHFPSYDIMTECCEPVTGQLVECACLVTSCTDVDDNGIRDDNCTWWDCVDDQCVDTPLDQFADLGGAFGECSLDGFANIHDKNHVLACFSGTSTCHPFNMDAGGAFGACPADGFCNIHDANHALASFAGTTTCSCPSGPAPQTDPTLAGFATLLVIADERAVRPGDEVEVRVFADSKATLRSYQLNVQTTGGMSGDFRLVDIQIEHRKDWLFARETSAFNAFNESTGQMLAGLMEDVGVKATERSYLATYVYQTSLDASGDFLIDVGEQCYLVAPNEGQVSFASAKPAVVSVSRRR
jgi:hypothetical protein